MKRSAALALGTCGLVAMLVRARGHTASATAVRRYFATWERGDATQLDRVVAPEYTGHVNAIAGTEERDRDALAAQIAEHGRIYAEREYDVREVLADGDRAAARVHVRAKHADTGREADMDGLVFVRVEHGRITEEWASWDYLGLAEQLGFGL